MKELIAKLDWLIDGWCERRALRPLSYLLPKYGVLAHTDQRFELLEALKDIKGLCGADISAEERRLLIEAINELEDALIK